MTSRWDVFERGLLRLLAVLLLPLSLAGEEGCGKKERAVSSVSGVCKRIGECLVWFAQWTDIGGIIALESGGVTTTSSDSSDSDERSGMSEGGGGTMM